MDNLNLWSPSPISNNCNLLMTVGEVIEPKTVLVKALIDNDTKWFLIGAGVLAGLFVAAVFAPKE